MIYRSLLLSTALAASVGFVSPALAQSVGADGSQESAETADQNSANEPQSRVDDIVVTAQRREERAQNVPIAISAFSADQLQARGINNTLQIGQFVPNLVAQNNTGIGSANSYFLRGLGSTETIATFDPPVGTYVDDIYLSRQNANNLALFDVDRVEVLRGPQGTLFGRNTTGGAVSVVMKQPGKTLGGYVEAGYGSYNKKLTRASIDLPLASNFAVKLSGYWQDDDGYARNITTGERLNDDDGWGVRLGVRGDLASWARWTAGFAHIVSKGDNIVNFDCNPANPANCDGRFISTGLTTASAANKYAPLTIAGRKSTFGLGQQATTDIVTSNLQFDVTPDTTLALITGYVALSQQFAYDFFDGRPSPSFANPFPAVAGWPRGGFTILNDGRHEQFSQEIKLNGKLGGGLIDYVAGFYYLSERNRTDIADLFSTSATTTLLLGDRVIRNTTNALAGYVQADLHVGPVTFTAGIRYTDEIKKLTLNDNRAACNVTPQPLTCLVDGNLFVPANGTTVPVNQPIPTELRASEWTPRFAINYKPTEDILLFASATRGFKSGGWNARATAPSQLLPFSPERVWSYEGGVKSEFFNHRLRANITVFHLEVSDLQILAGLLNPTTGALTFLTRNFANYRNTGVEAEFQIVPVTDVNLYVNVGYQNDGYVVPAGRPATDIYGIQSVAAQLTSCQQARAAGKIPGGPNIPATQPSITACAAGVVTANGTLATPVRTPDWSLAIGGSYTARFGSMSLVPSVNASYRSSQEVAIANLSLYNQPVTGVNGTFAANPFGNGALITGSQSRAAWLTNASLTLNGPDRKWSLSAECANCLDEAFVQSALSNFTYLNQPRTWLIRGRVNF